MKLPDFLRRMSLIHLVKHLSESEKEEEVLVEGEDEGYREIKDVFFVQNSRTIIRIGDKK